MTWLEVSRILTIIGTSSVTLGLYLQAYKSLKTQSVDDFSAALVISLVVNESVWLNYGMALGEWPIILISSINMPAVFAITVAYKLYRCRGATEKPLRQIDGE